MNKINYTNKELVTIEKLYSLPTKSTVLTGKTLSIQEILSTAYRNSPVYLTADKKILKQIDKSYQVMMRNISDGIPVYGANTAYGGQAGRVLNRGGKKNRINNARKLSEGLVFLDVGVGPLLSKEVVRSAMLIRVNMLLRGVSGIKLSHLDLLRKMLNKNITPMVNAYGGIGASGDLAHNQRVVNAMRGLSGVRVINEHGKKESARSALRRHKIKLPQLDPKEGLALVNGDNFSTAFAVEVIYRLIQYYLISVVLAAMTIEVLRGTDRSFHPLLAHVRPHRGQKEAADLYRLLLRGSKLAYQEMSGHIFRENGLKVQDNYSLRCLSQFEGVFIEKIKNSLNTITINANSVSDNPLWVPEDLTTRNEKPWQWVSGGNFLAMHMAEVLDTLRKIITQIIKRNDRQLARLIDPTDNNNLSSNLSDPDASATQCSFKGIQIQSGMFEVYSMLLANPVTTLFGTHEERNQDITSHAITSGILAQQNLEILKYSLASNLLAAVQGVDLRGGPQLLSPRTRPFYKFVRQYSKKVTTDRSLHEDVEILAVHIENGSLMKVAREEVFF